MYFDSISFKGDDNQVVIESTGKERIGKLQPNINSHKNKPNKCNTEWFI